MDKFATTTHSKSFMILKHIWPFPESLESHKLALVAIGPLDLLKHKLKHKQNS